jgi:hypothetical protein
MLKAFAIGLSIGLIGGFLFAKHLSKPKIEYVNQEIPAQKFDSVPDVTYVYKTVEKVRVDTVYVPVEVVRYAIIEKNNYLRINNKDVSVKYFDPETRNYVVERFDLPRRDWGFRAGAEVFADGTAYRGRPIVLRPGFYADLRYKRVTLGGTLYSPEHYNIRLRYDILQKN